MNLRAKFSVSVIALVVLVVLGISTMTVFTQRQLLKEEIRNQHTQLVTQLAQVTSESILQNELILINYFKGLKAERGFYSAGWVDLQGRVQLHTQTNLFGTKLQSPNESEANSSSSVMVQLYSHDGQHFIDYAAPIAVGGTRAGTARLLFDKKKINQFIHQSLFQTIKIQVAISLVALILGLIGAVWLSRTMVKPVNVVVDGLKEVAEGRLEPFPDLDRKDELGLLVKELNITIQKLKELDQMKREFTSSVTHELRSPLTAIEQLIALGLKGTYGELSNELRESLVTAKNYCTRLAHFVDDLLTTAKLESRRLDVYKEEFDLKAAIKEVEVLYTPLAKEKGISFDVVVSKDPIVINSDQGKIIQILSNLVSNAFKFIEKGSVQVGIEPEGDNVKISVSDTGPGIPADELPYVFEKFFRSPQSAKKVKGTGLGLSIVKSFTELLGGKVAAENQSSGGAKFSIWLPKHS